MTRRRRKLAAGPGHWSDNQKIEAVTTWLATGNLVLTGAALGIPEVTLRKWKVAPWWIQMVDDIRSESNLQLDAKLAKVVDKSVDAMLDRVESGDFQFDQKRGTLVRKPISARDANTITKDMIDRRELLQGKKEVVKNDTRKVEDRLLKLADEFAKFAKTKIIDAEYINISEEGK